MSYRKTPERCVGYKPLYKGRKLWILLNNPEKPFSIQTVIDGFNSGKPYVRTWDEMIIAYDRELDTVLAVGELGLDGKISAGITFGNGETFMAESPNEMASHIRIFDKEFFRE